MYIYIYKKRRKMGNTIITYEQPSKRHRYEPAPETLKLFDVEYLRRLDRNTLTVLASKLSLPELWEFLKFTRNKFEVTDRLWEMMFIDRYGEETFKRMRNVVNNPRRLLFSYAVYMHLIGNMKTSYGGGTLSMIELSRQNNREITLFLSRTNDEIQVTVQEGFINNLHEIAKENGFNYRFIEHDEWGDFWTEVILTKDNSENLDILIVQIVSAQMEAGARSGILP